VLLSPNLKFNVALNVRDESFRTLAFDVPLFRCKKAKQTCWYRDGERLSTFTGSKIVLCSLVYTEISNIVPEWIPFLTGDFLPVIA